jgi:hypothetical protein
MKQMSKYIILSVLLQCPFLRAMEQESEKNPLLEVVVHTDYGAIPLVSDIQEAIGLQPNIQEFIQSATGTQLPNGILVSNKLLNKAQKILTNQCVYDRNKDTDGSLFLMLDYLGASRKTMHSVAHQLLANEKLFKKLSPETQKIVLSNAYTFRNAKKDGLANGGIYGPLNLSHLKLDSMHGFSSWPFFNVQSIDFSHNSLSETYLKLFGAFLRLRILLLNNNAIETVSEDEYNSIPGTLRKLDLSKNKIQKFPRMLLQHKEKLQIFLNNNPLVDDQESCKNILRATKVKNHSHLKKSFLRIGMTTCFILGSVTGLATLIDLMALTKNPPVTMYYDVYTLFNCQVSWNVPYQYFFSDIVRCLERMVNERVQQGDWAPSTIATFKSILDVYNATVYQKHIPNQPPYFPEFDAQTCQDIYIDSSSVDEAKKAYTKELSYSWYNYNIAPQNMTLPSRLKCRNSVYQVVEPFPNFDPRHINVTFSLPTADIKYIYVILPTILGGIGLVFCMCGIINIFCSKYLDTYQPCTIMAKKKDRK